MIPQMIRYDSERRLVIWTYIMPCGQCEFQSNVEEFVANIKNYVTSLNLVAELIEKAMVGDEQARVDLSKLDKLWGEEK
jgi:hypothetical protein